MRKMAIWALAAIWPLALSAAGTQTITLKNGNQFHGTMINGSATSITFQDDNGDRHRFDTNEVQSINFSNDGNNNPGSGNNRNWNPQNNNNNPNSPNNGGFGNANRNPANSGAFGNSNRNNSAANNSRTLPSGTELSVRTNEVIDSRTATDGRGYSASMAQDVMDSNGNVVIPTGSDAQLVIKSTSGGSISGSSSLVLDLQSVMVNGQRYTVNTVNTEDIQQTGRQGLGANRRTGEIVGGGTALGTLLGAIGGGGKGAAIGALAGAAAGAGVQVLTKGNQVKVPAETVLNFRLDQPMQLSPANF